MAKVLTCAFLVACGVCTRGAAQAGQSSPDDADRLVVGITTYRNQVTNGHVTGKSVAAGTLVRFAHDTAWIVTAQHVVEDHEGFQVEFYPGGETYRSDEVAVVSQGYFAVLSVHFHPPPTWRVPRVVRSKIWDPRRVYALGCPRAQCWEGPLSGTIRTDADPGIHFRGLFLEPGFSGGPLVDQDGAIIGIITDGEDPNNGVAIRWEDILSGLARSHLQPNLPRANTLRRMSLYVKGLSTVLPSPGRDSDGKRLFRGARFETGVVLAPFLEFTAGLEHVAYQKHAFGSDAPDTYVTTYWTIGYRAAFVNPLFSVVHGRSDYASLGADLLIPSQRTAVVTWISGDSIYVPYGVQVPVRGVILPYTAVGMSLRAEYRVGLTEALGIDVAAALYMESIDDTELRSYPGTGGIQIGLDYRWKL